MIWVVVGLLGVIGAAALVLSVRRAGDTVDQVLAERPEPPAEPVKRAELQAG